MRKLLWLFIILFSSMPFAIFGQKINTGFTAGASLANVHVKLGPASVTSGNKAGITVGVFADIAVSGKFSFQPAFHFVQKGYNEKIPENDYTYKFGNNPDEDDMRALDFGANFLAGIETRTGFLVAVNYTHGLSDLAPGGDASNDSHIKNRFFGFKAGYLLKGKK